MRKALVTLLCVCVLCLNACEETYITLPTDAPAGTQHIQGSSTTAYTRIPTSETFDRVTVVDTPACAVTITGFGPEGNFGKSLEAELTNRSTDKTYLFSVMDGAVNNVMCSPFFAVEVAPGETVTESIYLFSIPLEYDIGAFTDIELTFRVYDSGDWLAEDVALETVHIYPYGQEQASRFVRTPQSTDVILYNDDGITVTVIESGFDSARNYTVSLFLENKSEQDALFSVNEASVNGYDANPFWAASVGAGKCAFGTMTWPAGVLEAGGITEVAQIEFLLRVYDSRNWLAEDLVNTRLTFRPDT